MEVLLFPAKLERSSPTSLLEWNLESVKRSFSVLRKTNGHIVDQWR